MSMLDFAKRLKCLRDKECALTRKEALLAKSSAKYHDAVDKLQTEIHKQRQELHLSRKLTEKLRCQNNKLEGILRGKQARLEEAKARVEQLQQTVEQRLAEQVQQRQLALLQMNKLCNLKECTNIFINLRALPDMVQGVTLCDKQTSTDWLPFCIAPLRHTQEEVQNLVWDNARNSGELNNEWEHLFFSDFRTATTKKCENTDLQIVPIL